MFVYVWACVGTRVCVRAWVRICFTYLGCGFGGLSVALSRMFPEKITLGKQQFSVEFVYGRILEHCIVPPLAMEIRPRVVQLVDERIKQLREDNKEGTASMATTENSRPSATPYHNVSVVCINIMKHGSRVSFAFCFVHPRNTLFLPVTI